MKVKIPKPNPKREKNQKETSNILKKERKKKKALRSARLVIRNLPFKVTEDDLKKYFTPYGSILEVNLLKKGDKLIGCGFLQFENKNSAAKALSNTSGKEFMGRTIIVDWAVPKDRFSKFHTESNDNSSEVVEIKEEPDDELIEIEDMRDDASVKEEYDAEPYIKSESESDDDSAYGNSDDDSSEEDNDQVHKKNIYSKNLRPTESSDLKRKHIPFIADDSHTVFLKNIPFHVSDDDLKKIAEEHGVVNYALICMDKLTEHSKGTGFVQYKDASIAQEILDGKKELIVDDVHLLPFKPMKKNELSNLSDKKTPKDQRNLYLVKEGVILAGSPASKGVSNGDMAKRLQLDLWKTQTLRNLHMFVSPVRLVVHNLPFSYNDAKLRKLIQNNAPKQARITEARVMKDLRDLDNSGVPKSKGYGFVSFARHTDALEVLRTLNNNPTIFTPSKRPIVSFSIENKKALQIKEKRLLNSQRNKDKNDPRKSITEDKTAERSQTNKVNKSGKVGNLPSESKPSYAGISAKFGSKKLRSKKELIFQKKLHIKESKKLKHKKKISRKEKRRRAANRED